MYCDAKHIDTASAIEHNRRIEQARQAEHLRRCAASPAYKRVYERMQEIVADILRDQATLQNAMKESIQQQRIGDIMGTSTSAVRPVPAPLPSDFHPSPNPLSALRGAIISQESLEQMQEDVKALVEIRQVNDEYDRHIIRKSCFSW